jgi:3-deoxy-D-manno-octulosonate 8-phosphate phosphatase (KDO 8-P phosphatase)
MNVLTEFKNITTFVFDIDGVLTNSTVLVLPDGVMARSMNIKDGYALQLAVKKGYNIAIISGGDPKEVTYRFKKLGIQNVFLGVKNKSKVLSEYLTKNNIPASKALFMGDDIPDFDVMKMIGLACCPNDAVPEIKSISKYISPNNGGEGCVRDVIEKVLKLNNHWHVDTSVKSQ